MNHFFLSIFRFAHIRSFIYLFILLLSFIQPFIDSFIHSFAHSYVVFLLFEMFNHLLFLSLSLFLIFARTDRFHIFVNLITIQSRYQS